MKPKERLTGVIPGSICLCPLLLLFNFFLFSPVALSCQVACNGTSCPSPGTTHIVGISPQVGVAGITYVYVNGYCFGDSQGSGSVTVNGEVMTNIVSWSDAEIIFQLPPDAQTGDLKVTSASYGSDDSASEATAGTWKNTNNQLNANFTVVTPNDPPFFELSTNPVTSHVGGSPSTPQYVTGTWYYNGLDAISTLTLTQGAQNSDGTYPVTGTEEENPGLCGFGTFGLNGILDQYGDLVLTSQCGDEQRIWRLLGSGDATSQGYDGYDCGPVPSTQYEYFFQWMTTHAEGPCYYSEIPPLFKSGTDLPSSETPSAQGWTILSPSTLPTTSLWNRTLPQVGGFTAFAGRFVYEQSGGTATDGCWFQDSYYAPITTGVTGGGWWVSQNGVWGEDYIGIQSQWDTYYQNYWGLKGQTCQVTMPQKMYIDGRIKPASYTTNVLTPARITPTELLTGVQPSGGQIVTECENYPSLKGKCR